MQMIAQLVNEEASERCTGSSQFVEVSKAAHEAMADAMWIAEDIRLNVAAVDSPHVIIEGVSYRKLEQESSAIYFGAWGAHEIKEPLYRMEGVRNGPTIKPIEKALGIIEGKFLPSLAAVLGALMVTVPDREVEKLMKQLGFRPPSRSTIEKGMGAMFACIASDIATIECEGRRTESVEFDLGMVSCGIDRFATRMDETIPDGPRRDAKLRTREGVKYQRTPPEPYDRNWRMAWAGNVTLYDKEGTPRKTFWYGAGPDASYVDFADRIASDVAALVEQHPDIKVATVMDGAPDVAVLRERLDLRLPPTVKAEHVIDFFHAASYAKTVAQQHGSDKAASCAWERYRHTLRHTKDGVDVLITDFKNQRASCDPQETRDSALGAAIKYYEARRGMMEYSRLDAEGYVLGSGATESACALQLLRVRRPGSHWGFSGLNGMLCARALWLSGRWDVAMRVQIGKSTARVICA